MRLFAEPRSLEAIVRQIKASGRAYPVFELGRLFLAGRDRYVVSFSRHSATAPQRAGKGEPVPEAPPSEGPAELFQVTADGSLWLSRDEAIRHILHGAGIQNFYRRETISIDPPKGTFTAVAVCGFSGEILGPPNHHSFQTTVARLHREKFYNLPLDRYKSRIRSEKDEALVAKWLEEQSTTVVYVPVTAAELRAAAEAKAAAETARDAGESDSHSPEPADAADGPAESGAEVQPQSEATGPAAETTAGSDPGSETPAETPAAGAPEENAAAAAAAASDEIPEEFVKEPGNEAAATAEPAAEAVSPLKSQAEMEAHFLQHHAAHAVRAVTRAKVPGNIPGKLLAPPLLALLRVEVEQQQRFPMQLVQDLCRDLEKQSLKFFKRDRKATFVCRTRPHYIADEAHLSPRLRSIVGVVRANPGITHPRLVSTMAPHVRKVSVPAPEVQAKGVKVTAAASASAITEEVPIVAVTAQADASAGIPATEMLPTEAPATEIVPPPALSEVSSTAEPTEAEQTVAEPTGTGPTEADLTNESAPPRTASPETETPAAAPPALPESTSSSTRPVPLPVAPEPSVHHLTSEEIAVLQDLRWLVQEGYVTEFASGELQVLGRPPQPLPEKKEKSAPEKSEAAPADPSSRGKGKNRFRSGPRIGDGAFTIWTRRAFNIARRAAEQAAAAAAAAGVETNPSSPEPAAPEAAVPDSSATPEPSTAPAPETPAAES